MVPNNLYIRFNLTSSSKCGNTVRWLGANSIKIIQIGGNFTREGGVKMRIKCKYS